MSHKANVSLLNPIATQNTVNINVKGDDTLYVNSSYPNITTIHINIADNSALHDTFAMNLGDVSVVGGQNARLVNDTASYLSGSSLTVGTPVTGVGSFAVKPLELRGQFTPSRLEFMGPVAHGQTVNVTGDPTNNLVSSLVIDLPAAFKGAVQLGVFGEVDLAGLANADSYSLTNDLLKIYSGCEVIDRLRLTTPAPTGPTDYAVSVSKTATGIVIDRGSVGGGTSLPVHMAGNG